MSETTTALNLEQFTEEELFEHIKVSIDNIGFDEKGFFYFIDPTLSSQIKLPHVPDTDPWLDDEGNFMVYSGGTVLATAGTLASGFLFNPLLFAPGGFVAASILSAPFIIDKIKKRKQVRKQIAESVDRTLDLYRYAQQAIQPKITEWLQESYNIRVTEQTTENISCQIIAHQHGFPFETKSGRTYHLQCSNDRWWVSTWNANKRQYVKLNTARNMKALSASPSRNTNNMLQKHEPETQTETVFSKKVKLLESQTLSVEAQHRLEAVKNEANAIMTATATLVRLGETSYHEKSDAAFALLTEELDALIAEQVEQEYFKLAVSERFVADRYRKPLQILKEHNPGL